MATERNPAPNFDIELEIGSSFPAPEADEWRAAAERSLRGRPLESLTVGTHEGLDLRPVYTESDRPPDPIWIEQPPIGGWLTCCPVDLREGDEAVVEAARGLARGAHALWLKTDRRSSSWERLTVGVLARMVEVAGGAPIFLDGRGTAPALAALLAAAARESTAETHELRGGFDFDPLGALAADGALPWALESSFQLMGEMAVWCDHHAPAMRAACVSTVPYAAAGASATDEIAYALATGVEYLRRLEAVGIAPDSSCRRLRFVIPIGRDFFMEIAKLRALQVLWTRLTDACGVAEEHARLPVHAITSPRTLSARDPWVNILRGTVQAFAAVSGTADVVTVLPYDAALGHPQQDAIRLALNTSTILREECHLGHVFDPAAGSYFVDRLTHDLAVAGWTRFQQIEGSGGMAAALRSGAVTRDLAEALRRKRDAVATFRDPITGVSTYPNLSEELPLREVLERSARPSPDDEATGVRRAFGTQAAGFDAAVADAGGGIALSQLIETLPGASKPERIEALDAEREGVGFERLRSRSDRHLAQTGQRPRVLVAPIGPPTEHRAASTWTVNLLATGGIAAASGEGIDDPAAAAAALGASGSRSAVICVSHERAPDVVPRLARELKERGARRVLVASRPGEHELIWRSAGVDGFVHRGCNAVEVLDDLLAVEGVQDD